MRNKEYKNIKKIGLAIIAFEGTEHLYNIISALRDSVDYVSLGLQMTSYHGEPISNVDLQEIYRLKDEDKLIDEIVNIELDTTKLARVQETDKRNMLIQDAQDNGCSHVIVIDSDEYYTKKSFERALQYIDDHDCEVTYCQYVNMAIDYQHILVYPFDQGMYVPFVSKVSYRHSFECTDFNMPSDPTRRYVLPYDRIDKKLGSDNKLHDVKHYTVTPHIFAWEDLHMNHLSWLRADIRKKLENWSSKKVFDNYDDLIDQAVYSYKHFDLNAEKGRLKMLFNTPDHSVDVIKLPKQYIHPRVDFNTRLRKAKDYKKILFLSMSADFELFNTLEETSTQTWKNYDKEKYPNVNAEFWTYTDAKPGENTHIDHDKHVIYIELDQSHENRLDATYSKTIEALHVVQDELKLDYDYLIRTNNSTWINVPLVNEFLAYANDDSMMYTGKLYSAFWSAFNIYSGGQFMCFSSRDVGIIMNIAGSVADAKKFENIVVSTDDNMLCGKINERLIKLGIPYNDVYHTIGEIDVCGYSVNETELDFACPVLQVKTYDVTDEERLVLDVEKMKEIDRLWNSREWDLEGLYERLLAEHYDKSIHIIPYPKKEWFSLKDTLSVNQKIDKTRDMPRQEALEFLKEHQVKCGYNKGIFL